MTSNKDIPADNDADFVLKHRITGAAFLIIFGVLFLPWLLSGPSQSNQANAESINGFASEASNAEIEQELLAAIENENIEEQELEVYVSRITPLDAQSSATNSEKETEALKIAEALKVAEALKIAEAAKTPPTAKEEIVETVTGTTAAIANPVVTEKIPEKVEPIEQVKTSVEVGWVVQVGVFTDSKGAAKVVADLKTKGFEPSTTIVDTNLGKATGTRVWLGPYAQRVEAAKSKTALKDKSGGDGFIRAYP